MLLNWQKNKKLLNTRDSDFANTLAYPPREFYGIVVLFIHPPRSELLVKALFNLIAKTDEFEGVKGSGKWLASKSIQKVLHSQKQYMCTEPGLSMRWELIKKISLKMN